MGFFNQPKPRRFNHIYQYVDERKERIEKLKHADASHQSSRQSIHEAFRSRRSNRPDNRTWQSIGLIVIILLFFLLLLSSLT